MKIIKLYFLLLILLFGVSCDKEEPYSLATDLQNGFWESRDDPEVIKFHGTNLTLFNICDDVSCSPDFPCIIGGTTVGYTIEDNTITTLGGDTFPIKIEVSTLTINNSSVYFRRSTNYTNCS